MGHLIVERAQAQGHNKPSADANRWSASTALTAMGATAIALLLFATPAKGQQVDSSLVARILTAEDHRDSTDGALKTGLASADGRVRLIAQRAIMRIRDPKFARRDSLPPLPAPPHYEDPAWRLRYRALANQRRDCSALAAALNDSVWAVRLRAVDLVGAECASNAVIGETVRRWASTQPASARRTSGAPSWQPAAHALLALVRIAPADAVPLVPRFSASRLPALRISAAKAAAVLADTARLRSLAADANDNVKEAAIEGLARVAGHSADDVYLAGLSASGYQAVRAAAVALKGSPAGDRVADAAIRSAVRLRGDSSETSRDARVAVLERVAEFATSSNAAAIMDLTRDFDCEIAARAASVATRLRGSTVAPQCSPMPRSLPREAVALALGREVRLRVTLADSSGGGSFVVRLRGDVAPIMSARILELARSGYYNGLSWQRVEPDFVIQGGSPGANEYVGYPRFLRDELGTVPHVRGTVGMSTRGHDTGDAQWFVNLRDNLRLNADYTIFGEVVDGIEVVDGVMEGDVIKNIVVIER